MARPPGNSRDLKSGPREYAPEALPLHNFKQLSQTIMEVQRVSSDTWLQVLFTVPLETAVYLRILLSLNPDINLTADRISLVTGGLGETVGTPDTPPPAQNKGRVWQTLSLNRHGSHSSREQPCWEVLPGRLVQTTRHVKDAPGSLSV